METRRTSALSSAETMISNVADQGVVLPDILGAVLAEGDVIIVRLGPGRLVSRRPDRSALRVLQEDVAAPVARVASALAVTARSRQRLKPEPAEVSMTAYLPFESMSVAGDASSGSSGGAPAAAPSRVGRGDPYLLCPGTRYGDVRGPLLQQQFNRLDHRFGRKRACMRPA